MRAHSPGWASDDTENERESRIRLALLRGVLENLHRNQLVTPVLALAICAIFSQWVGPVLLAAWAGQILLGFALQLIVLRRFPADPLDHRQARRWTRIAAAANLFFAANWTAMGWYLWIPGNPFVHILIMLLMAVALAGHATSTAACRTIARPAILLYLVAMVGVPLQGADTPSIYLALVGPFYVTFIVLVARQSHTRARAAIVAQEEHNALLAEVVMAKLDSDRGRDQAEAASVAKSQFLANMSHELRTPLNAILGFSELIASRMFEKDPERLHDYATMINTSGRHLLTLINDILDLAKIEAGHWTLEETELDLYNIADDTLHLVAWRAKDNAANLENRIDSTTPLLYGDARAIKQILLNLLSNAVKFTPPQGRIGVFAHPGADGTLTFGVEDTGVGIAPEDQARVFDSFGQGKHDITLAQKGTGLGLSIVKGLAEAHGGEARLESQVGKGTRISVVMPAARVRPRAGAVPDSAVRSA
jgi:two-component system cell cycle sensor histidine kinase PleC